ncbi:MAG: anaerobic ribonucleoside-triphosphate reductase activating protein [Coriobacteriia bacterium]|nr:anaerobic ribonucleoside-triphosphate reductase activating protein [Coriobacteriia bacterium]
MAATVFLKGCPWKCSYCHNKHLLSAAPAEDDVLWGQIAPELEKRRGFLDGVVFSGGEPLVCPYLEELIREVRDVGFLVGLHTNGTSPAKLRMLLAQKDDEGRSLVDWVGFDIKTSFDGSSGSGALDVSLDAASLGLEDSSSHYDRLTGLKGSGEAVRESLAVLQDSGVDYELRTTLSSEALDEGTLITLGEELLSLGEKDWVLQKCREEGSNREQLLSFDLGAVRKQLLRQGFEILTIR